MNRFSYGELCEFIRGDIAEFKRDGLDIRQATSRVQVEYYKSIKESDFEKLVIFMILCEEGVKGGFLREDIAQQTKQLLDSAELYLFDKELSENERLRFRNDIAKTVKLLGDNSI